MSVIHLKVRCSVLSTDHVVHSHVDLTSLANQEPSALCPVALIVCTRLSMVSEAGTRAVFEYLKLLQQVRSSMPKSSRSEFSVFIIQQLRNTRMMQCCDSAEWKQWTLRCRIRQLDWCGRAECECYINSCVPCG